jgi:hypothetical protein
MLGLSITINYVSIVCVAVFKLKIVVLINYNSTKARQRKYERLRLVFGRIQFGIPSLGGPL